MSLAWGSLVLLIVLLPGVLFFVGVYLPEEFTRDAEERSPLGQLAGALLVSFLVHGVAYALIGTVCGRLVPCVDLGLFLRTVTLDRADIYQVARSIEDARWWILTYVLATAGAGVTAGFVYGRLAVGRLSGQLARHPWVYDLSTKGLTYAHVLTHVKQDEKVLLYKGFLKAFGLQRNGQLSYVVLREVRRLYLVLGPESVETSDSPHQRDIGRSAAGTIMDPIDGSRGRQRSHSYLMIEGEDIANIVFDRLQMGSAKVSGSEFLRFRDSAEKSLSTLSMAEREAAAEVVQALGSRPDASSPAEGPGDPVG